MVRERRLVTWLSCTAGLGLVAALAPLLWAWHELPDPVAIHFGPSGAPNGTLSRLGWVAVTAGQALLALFCVWPRRRVGPEAGRARGAPVRLGVVGFMVALSVALSVVTLWHNWQRASWREAGPFEAPSLLPLIGIALLVGIGLGALAMRLWPESLAPFSGAVPVPPLAEGERTPWSGQASNGWFFLIALLIVLEGGLFQLMLGRSTLGYLLGSAHLLLLLTLESFSKIRVRVDEQALTICYGRLGWIRQRIALERVASAAYFELDPWEHGGWGYRGNLRLGRQAAVVVRAGRALLLELGDGKRFQITIDDAETAAGLINAHVLRRAQRRDEPPPAFTAPDSGSRERPLRA